MLNQTVLVGKIDFISGFENSIELKVSETDGTCSFIPVEVPDNLMSNITENIPLGDLIGVKGKLTGDPLRIIAEKITSLKSGGA